MSGPSIVQFDLAAYEEQFNRLREVTATQLVRLQQYGVELEAYEKKNEKALDYLSWRNYLLAQYNLCLVRLMKYRTQAGQTPEGVTERINELLTLQIKIGRLLQLETAQREQIAVYLRQAHTNQSQKPAEAVAPTNIDLFDGDEEQVQPSAMQLAMNPEDEDEAQQLEGIKEKQLQQRTLNRLKNSRAADEVFQAETDLPMERELVDQRDRALQDFEDEEQKRLSKRKKKEFQKEHKQYNQDGLLEGDLLDGIGASAVPSSKKHTRRDKK